MKNVLLTWSMITLAVAGTALALAEDEQDFSQGDLSSEELDQDEVDGLAEEERETFYRAQTQAQQEAHAKKRVQVVVTKSMKERGYQFVTIKVDGGVVYDSPVSTAWEREAKGKTRTYFAYTPVGQFFPDGMQKQRWSNLWQVMLQHVIRFSGGVWMHATTKDHFAELGAPASGGCVRLYPSDAKAIYEIVEKFGINETAITVLPADKAEPQIPWKQLKLPMPSPLIEWRGQNNIK
jgi:hypothetical protein